MINMKHLFSLIILFATMANAQNKLSVNVSGVKSSKGHINVAVYDTSDGFLKFDKVYMTDSTNAQQGSTKLTIDNLPDGEYALAVFHDINANAKLDKNWLGIPKEDIGFSNAKMKTFGPPPFEECVVVLDTDTEITVVLK